MKVDFVACAYWKDVHKLHAPGTLKKIVDGHGYKFDNIIVVHQNCQNVKDIRTITELPVKIIETETNPDILAEFRIPKDDPDAARWTDPKGPHWWQNHVVNHLNALKMSDADYVVFSDSDITIVSNSNPSWVEFGIKCLQKYSEVLIVSPDEGGKECDRRVPEGRMVRTSSQQIFLCERKKLASIDFHVPFEASALEQDPSKRKSHKLAPYGPFQEFYFMLEGRMWRYMDKNNLYRLMLKHPPYRYWHGPVPNKPQW
jgi:hypothetical protein